MATDGDIDLYGDTGEGDDLQQDTHYEDERFEDDIGSNDHKTDRLASTRSQGQYHSNTGPSGPPGGRRLNLVVGNLTWWVTDQDLIDAAASLGIGDVLDVRIYENRQNGQSKGYGIITVGSETSSRALMDRLPGKDLHGQKPQVMLASRQNLLNFENQARQNQPQRRGRDDMNRGMGGDQDDGPPGKFGRGRGMGRGGDRGDRDDRPGRENGYQRGGGDGQSNGPMMGGPFNPMAAMAMRPGMMPNQSQMGGFGGPNPAMMAAMMSGQFTPAAAAQMVAAAMGGGMAPGSGPAAAATGNQMQIQAALMAARMQGPGGQGVAGQNPAPVPGPRPGMSAGGPSTGQSSSLASNGTGNSNATANLQAQLAAAGLLPNSQSKSTPSSSANLGNMSQSQNPLVTSPGNTSSSTSSGAVPTSLASIFGQSGLGGASNPLMAAISAAAAAAAQQAASQHGSGLSEAEADEILTRNKTICSSAISRAVQDAAAGDFPGAIETLVTALSLIKQSKMANDERCKMLIDSLQNTLRGIEEKFYATKDSRRRSRSRSRERGSRRRSSRSRSRSRDRDYKKRDYDDDRGGMGGSSSSRRR